MNLVPQPVREFVIEYNEMTMKHWRNWAALVYLFICLCDFFVGPLWWNLLMWDSCADIIAKGKVCDASRWTPLTLQGGAMFHLAFGAILGATSWNKHKENNNGNGNNSTS